jgi:glycosyltransferase involved in cell wall biosynthesis
MSPKVTVIIPTYNAEDTIEQAINSIPKRDDIEIIFVNDGSTDNSLERGLNALKDYKRTRVVDKYNGGMASAVNAGLAEATGEYVVLLDADDDFYTDKFIEAMQYLDGTDLVYFDLQINSGAIWHLSPETKEKICGEVKFMRREFIQGIRWDESIRAAEDYYYYQELLKKNPTENFTGLVAKHYNYPREGSLSWQLQNGIIKNN